MGGDMKYTFRIVGALMSLITVTAGSANAEKPFTSGSFKEACAAAGSSKRIVLIDFYATWCEPCKMLDNTTWKDKKVRLWLAKTAVCLKIDAEKQTALASRYKIDAYPTILFIKPNGVEIDRLVGYRDAKTFLGEVKQSLSGKDSIARAKDKLSSAGSDNPMVRMEYADALAAKGKNAEALKEYLWCLDEGGKNNPSFFGVRLSFLLSDILRLGVKYPLAIDALKHRRDIARTALEKGNSNPNIALDFATYNENLGDTDQNLTYYDMLNTRDPKLAAPLFCMVASQLVEKKRYADMVAGGKGTFGNINMEIGSYKDMAETHQIDKSALTFLKQNFVKKYGEYYEALVGTDKSAEADDLRNKLLTFDASAATYIALIQHANRAEKPEAVQKLVTLAKKALPVTEFKQVEQAAK